MTLKQRGRPKYGNWLTQESTGTMYDNYAHHFADLISEKSNGRVSVEIYPVGQLGDTGNSG